MLAGECTPCEENKITRHLKDCPLCFREMEDLQQVNCLLNELKPVQAPTGLLEGIMASVENIASKPSEYTAFQSYACDRPPAGKRSVSPGFLRDLVAAAAVALATVWFASGWLAPLTNATEGKVSSAVVNYVHYTGVAMNRAQNSMTVINSSLSYTLDEFSIPTNLKQGREER